MKTGIRQVRLLGIKGRKQRWGGEGKSGSYQNRSDKKTSTHKTQSGHIVSSVGKPRVVYI